MDRFWTCSDCGSANLYPDIKECEVCGKLIDDYEIKQAEKHFREAVKVQEQIKQNELKAEKQKKQQEIEKKRKEDFEQRQKEKQQRIQKKIEKKGNQVEKCLEFEKNFFNVFSKSIKTLKKCMVCLLALSIFVVGIYIVRQGSAEIILSEFDSIATSVICEFEKNHYDISEKGEKIFKPFKNIERQYKYIEKHFVKSNNIDKSK